MTSNTQIWRKNREKAERKPTTEKSKGVKLMGARDEGRLDKEENKSRGWRLTPSAAQRSAETTRRRKRNPREKEEHTSHENNN
ncbi:hypothetical protein Nepgr_014792 [Nepenthes gracilis]|uniref:Uncharacterized protein n=1 Tax=Nepenthes gracilis TaxID=150966 RepID=A0AAD3SLV0_NEPGR|nr:hypothetical protein Nepgr_014792 [Nepenthes gracilis]